MNRATALLLAMAALLAHALAVHLDPGGRLGQPYEDAHAAFRLARNLVREGVLVWNPAEAAGSGARGGLNAHASPLLVAVAALAERLYLPVNRFVQTAGVLAGLLTIAASARFATDRSAGVIPALLLVSSGAFAAAVASGTELPLVAFALTLAFVARERRRPLMFAVGTTLLVASRVEGVLLFLILALFVAAERASPPGGVRRTPWWSLLPAVLVTGLLLFAPDGHGRGLYLARLAALPPDSARLLEGGRYLLDFLVSSVTPALCVFPVLALLTGRLSREGQRALLLALAWVAVIVAEGGGVAPFTITMVPALPMMALAIQFGVIAALDSRLRVLEGISWAALLVVALASALPSKSASQVSWHKAWIEQAWARPALDREPLRGRASLHPELVGTADLRALGRFLRERVDPELSILTPWSGVLGYLSGRTVLDLFGRRTCVDGTPAAPWPPVGSIDFVTALEQGADLVLPQSVGERKLGASRGTNLAIDRAWFQFADPAQDSARSLRLLAALEAYELVTVPVPEERNMRPIAGRPVRMLRRRALGLAPVLESRVEQAALVIDLLPPGEDSAGHPQLVDLEVRALDEFGRTWSVDPRGRLLDDSHVNTRVELVVRVGETRPVELLRTPLSTAPDGADLIEVRARLLNSRVRGDHPLSPSSETVVLALD